MIIQIITVNTDKLNVRVMIEKYSNNEFTVQTDSKTNEEKYYNGFLLYRNREGAVVFSSEQEVLRFMADSFFQGQNILSIKNDSSKLLTTAQIEEILQVQKV